LSMLAIVRGVLREHNDQIRSRREFTPASNQRVSP